jgi:glycosyltransferase involved in cell wall biosynthesis
LGIGTEEFLVCSFGIIGPSKLNHRLLDAWSMSKLLRDERCHLAFVGENHGGEYGQVLSRRIRDMSGGKRVQVTGFVDGDTYLRYLASADAAVQLRGVTRGEASRAGLDCLAHGLPLIANASGSLAELPDDALIMLPADFSDDALASALERVAADAKLRAKAGGAGRRYIEREHDPERIALKLHDAIERFARHGPRSRYRRLIETVAGTHSRHAPARQDLLAAAESIAFNLPMPALRQLFVDVSVLVKQDLKTGIERVARGVLVELLQNPPKGFRVEPVFAGKGQYICARRFTCGLLGLGSSFVDDAPAEIRRGDVFLGLDWAAHIVPDYQPILARYRTLGVTVVFVVYDLLPVLHPEAYPAGIDDMHARWLKAIAIIADGLICISRSVEEELVGWLDSFGPDRRTPLSIGVLHPGADIEGSLPTRGMPQDGEALLAKMDANPTALVVGTVEPRKAHRQLLAAFELLWRNGAGINLAIVGKQGWMVDDIAATLRSHPQNGTRLFWLEGISDEFLERIYSRARVLIAPSLGEGFGLPLVEAGRHGVPIIARELPVFREVAGPHAFYFSGTAPEDLSEAIIAWLKLNREGKHPSSNPLVVKSWKECVGELVEMVMRGRWDRTWLLRSTGDAALGVSMGEEIGPSNIALGTAMDPVSVISAAGSQSSGVKAR